MSDLKIDAKNNSNGFESLDDCSIYQINKEESIIQSLDFFTPIVDDPYIFGKIAATNALSDIYAMGGKPSFALNIVAFPSNKLDLSILSEILKGGNDVCKTINIPILGGHSIKDDVPKYGMCVTGIIKNKQILKNNSAKENDDLIITKPIGTGIITTALKKEIIVDKDMNEAVNVMTTLNNNLNTSIIESNDIHACTDITGFGLLGHLNEMCESSNLTAKININNIPLIHGTLELAKKGIYPGGTKKNLRFIQKKVSFNSKVDECYKYIAADAQTSGGLLISCNPKDTENVIKELNENSIYESKIIGKFILKDNYNIICH